MNSYFSTFITGFDQVIKNELSRIFKDIQIDILTSGLIVYKTNTKISKIAKIKFLNNSYVLLSKFNQVTETSIPTIVKQLIKDQSLTNTIRGYFSKNIHKFRIRAAFKNQFTAIDKNQLLKLEAKVSNSVPNFIVDRSRPDVEILITIRSEGFGLVGIQFTKRPNYEKTLQKGELYPELSNILCLISVPNKDDVFLDPFAGYGSIPNQRINFPHKKIIAGEIDNYLLKKLEKKFSRQINVMSLDAVYLKEIPDSSINKIVTDPPWGLYQANLNVEKLYTKIFKEFFRVLKENGVLVILTAQNVVMENLLNEYQGKLKLEASYSTLVSGKKAVVYKINKITN